MTATAEAVITGGELARELGVGPTALHRYCRTAGVPGCGSGHRYHLTADQADAIRLVAAIACLDRIRDTLTGTVRANLARGIRPPASLSATAGDLVTNRIGGVGRRVEVTIRRPLRPDELAPR